MPAIEAPSHPSGFRPSFLTGSPLCRLWCIDGRYGSVQRSQRDHSPCRRVYSRAYHAFDTVSIVQYISEKEDRPEKISRLPTGSVIGYDLEL